MDRDEQLTTLLEDLRKKQQRWDDKAKTTVAWPSFNDWWINIAKADAYQDAADQLGAILDSCRGCGSPTCNGVCQNEE